MNNPNSLLTAGQIQMRVLPEPRELAAYLDEKISSPSGILDSPIEVNMVERMLYINRNGKPTK